MNFRPRHQGDEPEINLIPFIDVLLVVLIFLMLSTTYSKFTELQVKLPVADANAPKDYPKELIVAVSSDGRYAINSTAVNGQTVAALSSALALAAQANNSKEEAKEEAKEGDKNDIKSNVVIISADASAPHQAVITVMEAARRTGLSHITFATQSAAQSAAKSAATAAKR